ncbi:MAG: DUF192 domain-containing protein [Bacteriovoracaceae bacterium]
MRITHKKTNKALGESVKVASSFIERLKGLMFIKEMKDFDGLLIQNCNSVHNCFVRFPIDVVFLSSDLQVVKILRNFKPWRFSLVYLKAKHALELPAGSVGRDVNEGDFLEAQGV